MFITDICIVFIIVTKEYKCPVCGEEVELDEFNDHVKNRHKGNLDIKYMCRTCEKKCDDILKHLITVHNFSKATVESQLATNPNSYRNAFKKLKE